MEPSQVDELRLGSHVWVWLVRFGDGRWWPGTVKSIDSRYGAPLVQVSYESFARGRSRNAPPVPVGHVLTPMRRLEHRALIAKGSDRPRFIPVSRLRQPEVPICANNANLTSNYNQKFKIAEEDCTATDRRDSAPWHDESESRPLVRRFTKSTAGAQAEGKTHACLPIRPYSKHI